MVFDSCHRTIKKMVVLILICSFLPLIVSCSGETKRDQLEKIEFVLDWAPNTNHTGLYAAKELGYFEEEGFDVTIQLPPEDSSTALVGSGKAQFCIGFQDSLAAALSSDHPLPVIAVAAVLQHNTSGIVSKKGNGIDRPKGLENKDYATWSLPIEQAMLKYVVEKDGGDFSKVHLVPNLVTDVVSALSTNIDAVNIFYGWDGIATKVKGLEIDFFLFKDLNEAFDYYTPVIVANEAYTKEHPQTVKRFLRALSKGYQYAIEYPENAAEILLKESPELDRQIVLESQKWLTDQYQADAPYWGVIDRDRWNAFYSWLYEEKLISIRLEDEGFTNEFLEVGARE